MEPFEHQTIFETEADDDENKSNQQTAYLVVRMLIKQSKAVSEYTTRGSATSHPKHGRVFSNNEDSKKGLPQLNFSGDRKHIEECLSDQTHNDHKNYYAEKGLDGMFNPLRHGIQSAVLPTQREILCYPVARYPDNQNPLLPLSLQKKLGAMSPREFLETVLRELSLDERESLLVDEKQRRTTFLVNWPHDGNLSGIKMAQAGFYCVDNYDRVQCVFCRGSLHKWEEGDNPMTEHAKMFPFCRFAKGLECGNKEYRSDVLGTEELKNITFLCVPELKKNRDGSVTTNSNALGISTNKAAIIKYAIIESRKNTFARWPASNALDADSLWEAGFYYTGFDDQVRCFFCAGGLRDWSVGDDPWQEHARWFPDCSFLIQHKGEVYVNEVHRTTADGKKCSRQTILQKKAEKEYKQKVSQQKALHDLCIKLGHERQLVDLAINRNGKAFDNAKDLVVAVYKLEEEEDMGMETERSSQVMHFMSAPSAPIKAQEDVARVLNGDQEMLGGIQTDGVELIRSPGTCFNCFNRRGQKIDATEVALPCGHLIFCDKCGQDEKDRVDKSPLYKSKCPTRGCSSLMTGLFKTYVS
ncbi:baculoviral IAP repeat-containing protein 7-like isoform X2 [Watersipora subatra]|uniref:baculoviral IAP repeat-containing protein 7-like isoform X2 n=1 Tax=Watersipora subatra TaxID=2589382 RepID=UPI00355C8CA4